MNVSPNTSSLTELLSHSEWLRVLARQLVADEATADDLVQETWIAVMKNPPSADRPARPWLAGIARNLAKLRFRKESRLRRRQAIAAKEEGLPSSTELIEQVETERHLASVVLALDEPLRTTVLLHYFQDLTLAEIGKRQGVPAATVRWRHARGLELLREKLSREYGENQTWCTALLVLARAAPSPRESLAGGGALAGACSLLVALKVVAALLVLGMAIWGGPYLLEGLRTEDDPLVALSVEESSAAQAPMETKALESSSERTVRQEPAPVLGSNVTSEPEVSSLHYRVHLVDESVDTGVLGRRIVILDGEGDCHSAQVGEDGWASFEELEDPVHLYVARPSGFAHAQGMVRGEFELWVRLIKGVEFSGRAYVGDRTAPAGLELQLIGDSPAFGGRDWPEAISQKIFAALGAGVPAVTRTEADGRFVFRGLTQKWAGVLVIPDGFGLGPNHPPAPHRYGGGEVRVDEPRGGFVLQLAEPPILRGRVLDDVGLSTVPGAVIRYEAVAATGETIKGSGLAGPDGRIELKLVMEALESLHASVSAADGRGHSVLPVKHAGSDGGFDLGDVRLSQSEPWTVRVQDAEQLPISGASVCAGRLGPRAPISNHEGLAQLHLPLESKNEIEVSAPGYATARLPRPLGEPRELSVTLASVTRLTVDLELPPHVRTLGLSLLLERSIGSVFQSGYRDRSDEPSRFESAFSSEPRIELDDLVPGATLSLSIVGAMGDVLHHQLVPALVEGESRIISVPLFTLQRKVHATVKSNEGMGLSDVSFRFSYRGGEVFYASSDRKGAFRQDYLPTSGLTLEVSKRGFETLQFDDASLPGRVNREQITMKRARDVEVVITNASGQRVSPDRLSVIDPASRRKWPAPRAQGAKSILMDVPRSALQLQVSVGGRAYERELPAEIESFVLEL